jgi:hypothetical protein
MCFLCANINTFSTLSSVCSYLTPIITAFAALIAFYSEKSEKNKRKLRIFSLVGIVIALVLGILTIIFDNQVNEIQSCLDEEKEQRNKGELDSVINRANSIATHPFFPVKLELGVTITIGDDLIETFDSYADSLFRLQGVIRDGGLRGFAVDIINNKDYEILGGAINYNDSIKNLTYYRFNELVKKIVPEGFVIGLFDKKIKKTSFATANANLTSYCYPTQTVRSSNYSFTSYYNIFSRDNRIELTMICSNPNFTDNLISLYSIYNGTLAIELRLPYGIDEWNADNIKLNGLTFNCGNEFRDRIACELSDSNRISGAKYIKYIDSFLK